MRDNGGVEPLVTVVVPARNEEKHLADCLDSILAQTYTNLDVVVVDGASTDKTAAIAKEYAERDARVRLVSNPAAITPVSLNVGLSAAKGKWLVRVDAHSTVPPQYVEIAAKHLAEDKWGGVGGRKDGVGITAAGRAIAIAMSSPFAVGNSTYHHGNSVQTVDHIPFGAYPVDLVRAIGGWDESLKVNQDFEFDWRIRASGHPLLFDPALRIDWLCRQSVPDLLKQYFRYGRGKAKVMTMHPKSIAVRHLAAPALVAWLVLALVVSPVRPILAALMVAPYILGVLVASVVTAGKVQRGDRKYLPSIFPAMHLGWGLGFYRGIADVVFK